MPLPSLLIHARSPFACCDSIPLCDRPFPTLLDAGKHHHLPGSDFMHSVADSMRESSGIARHDAPKVSAQLPEGEAPEPGTVDKMKASISGVAGASQVLGWGAQGTKPERKGVEGAAVAAPSIDAGVDVSAPALDASAEVSAVQGGVTVPAAAEEGLTLPSGSADAGCE